MYITMSLSELGVFWRTVLMSKSITFQKIPFSFERVMVLGGLTFSSCQAWLAGVYFVKRPWGLPIPTGFCFHPYIVYAFALNIVSYVFWADCFMKLYPISSQLSLTAKILADAVLLVTAVFDFYFRFTFYRLNVPLAELLIALEQPKYKPFNDRLRKCWKSHKLSLLILAVPRYILAFTLVCSFGLVTSDYPDSAFYIPRYTYFALFMVFTAVPSVASILFAYDLIVITTFHMLWTFEDYCAHLEDHIYKGFLLKKRYSLNPTPSVRSFITSAPSTNFKGGIDNGKCTTETNEFRNLKRLSDAEEGKGFEKMSFNCFVERFDWIQGLADNYNRCIGPIILGVVVRCVFSIVHAVNALALKTASQQMGLKSWYHVLVLLVEISQLVILKLGSEIHQRISFWKSKLNKAWLLSTSAGDRLVLARGGHPLNSTLDSEDLTTTNFDEMDQDNQLVQDLVNYVCTWNWKVSAAGIFDIDKALLSGIVSTTLTYVIILFQLNLADPLPRHVTTTSDNQDTSMVFDISTTTNSSRDYLL